jgi:hypothetical protein
MYKNTEIWRKKNNAGQREFPVVARADSNSSASEVAAIAKEITQHTIAFDTNIENNQLQKALINLADALLFYSSLKEDLQEELKQYMRTQYPRGIDEELSEKITKIEKVIQDNKSFTAEEKENIKFYTPNRSTSNSQAKQTTGNVFYRKNEAHFDLFKNSPKNLSTNETPDPSKTTQQIQAIQSNSQTKQTTGNTFDERGASYDPFKGVDLFGGFFTTSASTKTPDFPPKSAEQVQATPSNKVLIEKFELPSAIIKNCHDRPTP